MIISIFLLRNLAETLLGCRFCAFAFGLLAFGFGFGCFFLGHEFFQPFDFFELT